MNQASKRVLAGLSALTMFSSLSPAYYYYTHYNSRTAPFVPIVEKFDVNALPNKTAAFYISELTNVQMVAGDSVTGLVSQIRAAAKVWNDVDSSDLRLSYGGIIAPSTQQSYPPIQVTFDDVPPGIVALGGPVVRADSNGSFIPITRSVLIIRPDFTKRPTVSYSEDFFGTLVHEFGHALGLQHTLTSSVMSTSITRATTKSRPLATDDIAGISNLYPAKNFLASMGSVSGRVTLNGQGVNLASVVAISPGGPVVSAMTNPDGTYQINGLPPRQYLVYVHPLPPPLSAETTPANIQPPLDADRRTFPAAQNFETLFYPGTRDPQQAFPLNVTGGSTNQGINFNVRSTGATRVYAVQTYAFPGTTYIKPPYLNPNIPYPFLVSTGVGLVSGVNPAPGLNVSILGGSSLPLRAYSPAPDSYVEIDVDVKTFLFNADNPRHLLFSFANDIYVLPNGFFQASVAPPTISSIALNGDRSVSIVGTNLSADSRVIFDGLPATVRGYDDGAQKLTVVPPPAPTGYKAAVVILNSDGQSSLFLQGDAVSTFTYDNGDGAAGSTAYAAATPSALNAGTEVQIQIDVQGATLVDGQTVIGFGSNDIQVRRVWVVSPTRAFANVVVNNNATPGAGLLSITTGLQYISQPFAIQIQPAGVKASLSANVQGQPNLFPGATAVATVLAPSGPLSSSSLTLNLNDKTVPIISTVGNQITFQIPAGTATGLATLRLDVNGDRGFPIGVQIDNPPAPSN